MKKLFKAVIVAGAILMSGSAAASASASTQTEYQYLLKYGTHLEWYTVNKIEKGNKFTAIDPIGKKLVFNASYIPHPEDVKKWSRVRAYVNKGKVLTVEVVKPKLVEYKVKKITYSKTSTTYYAAGKNRKITIPRVKMEGVAPKVGSVIIGEIDTRYKDAGFIKAYKK